MKTLLILAIILAIFSVYFVLNTEKSISLKSGGNAIPAGTDIAKFILDKVLNQSETIKPKISEVLQSGLIGEVKSKIGEIKNKILDGAIDLIKKPIENKASEIFCSQK